MEVKLPMVVPIVPKSGIQVLIIVGAALMITATAPDLGVGLLLLGVAAWFIYNLLNLPRQI